MRVLITGGAGFIGSNAAARLRTDGHAVTVFDDLSRFGSRANLDWLQASGPVRFVQGDVRDAEAVRAVLRDGIDAVLHCAAQVAVTTSLVDPLADFSVNAGGTVTVLEAVRTLAPRAFFLYTSTNKVYGELTDLPLEPTPTRWVLRPPAVGIDERRALDFRTPYACSKGAGDQYVLDYARTFGLRTVVLRQSAIYGPRQFGVEDQGWLAWFAQSMLAGRPLVVYGDGRQVRDVLYVDDLTELYARLLAAPPPGGTVFNVGGGPGSALSVREAIDELSRRVGPCPPPRYAPARPGDQRFYVSDLGAVTAATGWSPRVAPSEGLSRLLDWTRASADLLAGRQGAA